MDNDKTEQARRAAIAERVTPLSPELQQLELRRHIITDLNDSLMDLTEEAIQTTAVVRTTHEYIVAIPGANAFCIHMGSLSRSRKRLGKMEACSVTSTPVAHIEPSPHDKDIEEERRYREAVGQDVPWWKRILGGGR